MLDSGSQSMRRVRHIHFIGIGGAGMGGIAEVLLNLGYEVSGTDLQDNAVTRRLSELGARIGHEHTSAASANCDVAVYSSAVPDDNPELLGARARRTPLVPRAEMLAELMRFREGIAIAGTHGKTTTTSLIAHLLSEGGLDPTFVIGGRLNSADSHARLGTGRFLVAEADESDASFLHLQPVIAVLTNIDADHMDTYGGDVNNLRQAFVEFFHRLPFYGLACVCIDDPGVRAILDDISRTLVTYGTDPQADLCISEIEQHGASASFRVSRRDKPGSMLVKSALPGRHNVYNAVAAIAVAQELEVADETICRALAEFQGIARRCQVLGEMEIGAARILVIDDYGHHPREIAVMLETLGCGWPGRRLVVVFQPHRYTRTRALFEDFVNVLITVDLLVLLEVYPAGEDPIPGADGRALSRAIRLRGIDPVFVERPSELDEVLPQVLQDGDVLLILGAGDVGEVGQRLLARHGEKLH